MGYKTVPKDHSEFGGGTGLIDPVLRADRVLNGEEELMEIYATNPMDPEADPATADLNAIPRPAAHVWKDKSTAAGTN